MSSSEDATASNNSAATAPSSGPVTATTVFEGLKSHTEWSRGVVFDAEGRVIASTFKHVDGEIDAWTKLFAKREDTIASGIILLNEQYDVHRFHPPLIYGRRGDPTSDDSEGICACRVERNTTKTPMFALITYSYPTLSARAAPQLKEFCETVVANLV